ncbi:MAG: 3-methyladenine glycosylase/8-oxoguanine glycosylase [Burkholderiales bacterium]|jgi:AraC family transcriptional regulator of adaptative response / DNA-3-methyladenine glycosylase II|nr:3-methyladenine glycosylase/8-oxoguanine glycosylase [Burkholderiales bacterium]
MKLNPTEFYRAHLAKDPRFDGKFFVAVKTTGIYCRPICPAKKAKLENLEFYIHAYQAEAAGFRPCLRCRPETASGSAAWIGTCATTRRALRIMENSALERLSVKYLADKLGISPRWLRELFTQQLGANPQTILLSKKLDVAKNLLETSNLSITDIAFSSGFQSIRRFNDAFKLKFSKTPSSFRNEPFSGKELKIQLNYRPPYDWSRLISFFGNRSILQMELITENSYQRLITYGDVHGWFKATICKPNKIEIEFKLNKNTNIIEFIRRIKNIFDLDCDPMAIEHTLKEDKQLVPFLKTHQGLRIPGGWDGFELAIRAIIGQKISVKGARTTLSKLVTHCGEKQHFDKTLPLTNFFPTPDSIIRADLTGIGLTTAKINSIKALAQEIVNGNIVLDGTADFEDTCKKLLAIKGIGPWTVQYIAMRALRNPDAFPETDLELQKKIKHFKLHPAQWAPWRAYAALLLWNIKT